jgi:hypothetical protein
MKIHSPINDNDMWQIKTFSYMEPEIIKVAEARKSKVIGTPFKNRQYEPLTNLLHSQKV